MSFKEVAGNFKKLVETRYLETIPEEMPVQLAQESLSQYNLVVYTPIVSQVLPRTLSDLVISFLKPCQALVASNEFYNGQDVFGVFTRSLTRWYSDTLTEQQRWNTPKEKLCNDVFHYSASDQAICRMLLEADASPYQGMALREDGMPLNKFCLTEFADPRRAYSREDQSKINYAHTVFTQLQERGEGELVARGKAYICYLDSHLSIYNVYERVEKVRCLPIPRHPDLKEMHLKWVVRFFESIKVVPIEELPENFEIGYVDEYYLCEKDNDNTIQKTLDWLNNNFTDRYEEDCQNMQKKLIQLYYKEDEFPELFPDNVPDAD